MKHNFQRILGVALLLCNCREERANTISRVEAASTKPPLVSAEPHRVEVRTYGALRAMMHEGKTGPAVSLSTILGADLFALGALSELRGEVTVLSGKVWLGYPGGGDATRVESVSTTEEKAALLVAANVKAWREVVISEDIPWAALDRSVEALANSAGADVQHPFPVIIQGPLEAVEWHVIDGSRAHPGPSNHEQHKKMAAKGTSARSNGVLLGFFSKSHQGIFTHHGQNTHFHFVDEKERVTGHVDSVIIKKGAVLRVPR